MDLQPGAVVQGRYRIERVLHDGTKFMVAEGRHVAIDARVAIKVLKPDRVASPEILTRFRNEARLISSVGSEHVVQVMDFGVTEMGATYVVLELLDGETLKDLLARSGTIHPAFAVELALQICEGLAALHGAGIVHRNLEPSNVMIVPGAAGTPVVKIIDLFLGLVPVADRPPRRGPIPLIGTPPYAAPEQLDDPRSSDPRADLWSVGGLLATMVAGQPPYSAPSLAELIAMIDAGTPPTLSPTIPPALARIIERCLAHDRAERYATVVDLVEALAPLGIEAELALGVVGRCRAELARG